MDFHSYCTSLVEMVISEIITEMTYDTTLSTLFGSDVGYASDMSCSSSSSSAAAASTFGTEGSYVCTYVQMHAQR